MHPNISSTASKILPAGIDAGEYDSVCDLGSRILNPNSAGAKEKSAWFVFVNAWTGLAYRLVAAQSYSDTFCVSIQHPTTQDRYTQDHALFGFTFSALSAIECLYMAVYGVGAMYGSEYFPLDDPKQLIKNPENVAMCFAKFAPNASFTKALGNVSSETSFQNLRDLRNALSHRGALGRKSQLSSHQALPQLIPSNPKALPAKFRYESELLPNLTTAPLEWVIQSANSLIKELEQFLLNKQNEIGPKG